MLFMYSYDVNGYRCIYTCTKYESTQSILNEKFLTVEKLNVLMACPKIKRAPKPERPNFPIQEVMFHYRLL